MSGATTRPRVATYRVQLTPAFGFREAAGIVADLAELGVSHLYLSPVAEAVRGSTHGYDVVRPWEVRSELGGREGLWELANTVRGAGLGLLIDVVPNHVATTEPERNPWWWSLLAEGRDSTSAGHFDIDWDHGADKVIVPTLGRALEEAIEAGELVVDGDRLRYYDKAFPITDRAAGRPHEQDRAATQEIVRAQHYRLTHWRDPQRNVRRFFTIDDLAAVRPEVSDVANAIAGTAVELAADGLLDGVRVDHIDGLAEPRGYLEDLRSRFGRAPWLLVEKILVGSEALPSEWPVGGTTGYEWIRMVDHLFTNPAAEARFTHLAAPPVGELDYHEVERAAVREVLAGELRPDLERVARTAAALLDADGDQDVDPGLLAGTLVELTAELGRYRTYLPTDVQAGAPHPLPGAPTAMGDPEDDGLPNRERGVLERAAQQAGARLSAEQATLLDRVVEQIGAGTELTRRWQQLSGPALAKGGEDRALYRWLRLGAHNEVGGDPGSWSTSLDAFHAHNAHVCETCPHTLLAGSTHDTKRSEDTRARLLALTEVPELWAGTVADWTSELEAMGAPLAMVGDLGSSLALQTVLAAWPLDAQRLGDYLVKAAREAHLRTSWTDPDADHETALVRLAELLTGGGFAARVETVLETVDPIAHAISLAQLALRLTAPGVPDLYQGSERWLHTLVDPDNRRDLDVQQLRSTLGRAKTTSPRDGPPPKAAVIARVLSARSAAPECFTSGSGYHPIRATGTHGDHVVAFARTPASAGAASDPDTPPPDTPEANGVVTVTSRFPASRGGWGDTRIDLPDGSWRDVLAARRTHTPGRPPDDRGLHSGATMLDELLGKHPAAVLVRDAGGA